MEIPRDIMEGYADEAEVEFQKTYRLANKPAGNPVDIEKAAQILDEAQRPVVIAGSGAFYSKAQNDLKEVVEKTGIPFFTRNAAAGWFLTAILCLYLSELPGILFLPEQFKMRMSC